MLTLGPMERRSTPNKLYLQWKLGPSHSSWFTVNHDNAAHEKCAMDFLLCISLFLIHRK